MNQLGSGGRRVLESRASLPIGCPMRINVLVDDELMAEALAATGLRTKRQAVEMGLRLLARRARQAAAAELFGAVRCRGDLDGDRRDGGDQRHGRGWPAVE